MACVTCSYMCFTYTTYYTQIHYKIIHVDVLAVCIHVHVPAYKCICICTYIVLPDVQRTKHLFLTVQAAVTPTNVLPAPEKRERK